MCAQTAWTHANLTADDHRCVITVATDPPGHENLVDLEILNVEPLGDGQGTLGKISDTEWHYTALQESQSDKWPGWDDPNDPVGRLWEVTIRDTWSGETVDFKVRCVFRYCVMNESDEPMALQYVQWKYAAFIAANGLTVGTYNGGSHYGQTDTYDGDVTYGDPAFTTENILLSTIGHEDVHVDQGMLIRLWGAEDRAIYEPNVALGLYPAPPLGYPPPGSEGGEWGDLEYPARRWEWLHQGDTGIDNDGNYLPYVQVEMNFFEYLRDNCD